MVFKIESGETVQCIELNTGNHLAATFRYDEESIRAHVYSFSDFFHIKDDGPIYLLSEKLVVVSLYENISNPPGHTWTKTPSRKTYRQDIISNIAVCGPDEWKTDDRIKRVSFKVKHSDGLLFHSKKVEALYETRHSISPDRDLFSERIGDVTIASRYSGTYSGLSHGPKEVKSIVDIDFATGVSLDEYLEHVTAVVTFFSFCLGARLKPSDIHISRHSNTEIEAKIKAEPGSYPGDHDVVYVWPDAKINTDDLWVGASLVHCRDDNELHVFRQALQHWTERYPRWKKAVTLMMGSLKMRDVMSSDRLINACKWFEDIPLTTTSRAISDGDIDAIAAVAAAKAAELGLTGLLGRITGSIKTIRSESHEARFRRLVNRIQDRFGAKGFETMVADLKMAIDFRGKVAHGHFAPADEAEYKSFARAIYAMEAFCYLLMALELPATAEGPGRLRNLPIVRNYLLAFR